VSRGDEVSFHRQTEKEGKQAMTIKSFSILSAMAISLSLEPSQASAKTSGRITIAEEARQTLEDLRDSSAAIANEADQLGRFASDPRVSVESHSQRLMDIRDGINRMGREIAILDAEHEALPAWEQQAVLKALPLLKDCAANAESALEYLNTNKDHLWTEAYRSYTDRILQDSEHTSKTLASYLKLAKLEGQERHLEDSLATTTGN
jgi:hypothetical protein